MEETLFYHWWSCENEPSPYQNLRTPILLSIATFRACSNKPIVVLDVSKYRQDWGEFPNKLNFKVIPWKCYTEKFKEQVPAWQLLSRIFDIRNYLKLSKQEKTVLYADSDVFFLKDPFPLNSNPDFFCWDKWNAGLFYYRPASEELDKFYEIYKSYTVGAIFSEDIKRLMKKYIGYNSWYGVWEEMMLTYMTNVHPELFQQIPKIEHCCARDLKNTDFANLKAFHCNGLMVNNDLTKEKHARGLLCLIAEEFYRKINSVLDQNDIELIFGKKTIEYYLPKQINLYKKSVQFQSAVDETGHFLINKLI